MRVCVSGVCCVYPSVTLPSPITITKKQTNSDIAKLTPSRVTAMAVHPSERNLVVVAADVDGYFGVWQVRA